MHCSQQHQLMHTIQLALNNVLKELEDVDKRLEVVPPGWVASCARNALEMT